MSPKNPNPYTVFRNKLTKLNLNSLNLFDSIKYETTNSKSDTYLTSLSIGRLIKIVLELFAFTVFGELWFSSCGLFYKLHCKIVFFHIVDLSIARWYLARISVKCDSDYYLVIKSIFFL